MTLTSAATAADRPQAETVTKPAARSGYEPAYLWQSARGHLSLWWSARPVDDLIDDPATRPSLRQRLELAKKLRRFAVEALALPDNGSFTRFAQVDRPHVVWNVQAAPELSLEPVRWCFPVAGCVAYRGYYHEGDAEAYAASLRAEGLDVQVAGVSAYSTLGWFADPLLSTFIGQPEPELAQLIFHELAHQVVWVPGDTRFNESFATAVERIGVERWLAHSSADPSVLAEWLARRERRRLECACHSHTETLQASLDASAEMRARDDFLPRVAAFVERNALEHIEVEHLGNKLALRRPIHPRQPRGDVGTVPRRLRRRRRRFDRRDRGCGRRTRRVDCRVASLEA